MIGSALVFTMSAQCALKTMLWELGTLLRECYAKRVVLLAAACNNQHLVRIGYLDGPIPNNEQQPPQHPMTSRQKDLSRVRYPVRSFDALSVALFVATFLSRSCLLSFFPSAFSLGAALSHILAPVLSCFFPLNLARSHLYLCQCTG